MERRTLLTAATSGTIVGFAGRLSSNDSPRTSDSESVFDPDVLSSQFPGDDECVGAASLSELVERRYGDKTVSGRECPTLFVENRREESITADIDIDRPPQSEDSDETRVSFEETFDPRAVTIRQSAFEPADEVDVAVTVDDERFETRWTGPPCYDHVLAITDDGLETDTYHPCTVQIEVENERDEPITASVDVHSVPKRYDEAGLYIDNDSERYEETFDVEPGATVTDFEAFRSAEDLGVTVTVDGDRFHGQWAHASCLPHVITVTDDGIETDVRSGCELPFVIENERDESITASVDVESYRPKPTVAGPDVEPEPFEETFDLEPGERSYEARAFHPAAELEVTVAVDGDELRDQWTSPSCYAHVVAITDDGLEVGAVPTLNGSTDFSHDCFPGSTADLRVKTEDASWAAEVSIENLCTGSSTAETLEVPSDGSRYVAEFRNGTRQEITVDVDGGKTASEVVWGACWGLTVWIDSDGSVDFRPVPIL